MQSELMQLLKDYGDQATKAINLAVEDEANDLRKRIRQEAGSGWQIDKQVRAMGVQCTIYNGSVPGLVHLLEKGHRVVAYKKNRGQAPAFAHVGPSTQNLDSELEEKIQKNLDLLS